jgi:hypothetical protein
MTLRKTVFSFALFSLATLALPTFAPAAVSVTGDSNTYLQSGETADKAKVLDLFEYLNFSVKDDQSKISFHAGGWADYDLGHSNPSDNHLSILNDRGSGDLQYGYLSYRDTSSNAMVNLGRVLIAEGVEAGRIDGIYARTDLDRGFGIAGYGGRAVDSNVNNVNPALSDTIYGGRVSQQMPGLYRVGVSAMKEERDGADFRKEYGFDVWVHPYNRVDISGKSSYNELTAGWSEHSYLLMLGPFDKLRLDTTFQIVNYDDYFYHASLSALSILNGYIFDDEKVQILGESATYSISDNMQVVADYKSFSYAIRSNANYYGGQIRYRLPENLGAGFGYHRMDGFDSRRRYNEYRIYAYKKYGHIDVTADLMDIAYDKPIFNVKDSYAAVVSAGYEFSEKLKVGADLEYGKNPNFDTEYKTLVKLSYSFDAAPASGGKAAENHGGKEEAK